MWSVAIYLLLDEELIFPETDMAALIKLIS